MGGVAEWWGGECRSSGTSGQQFIEVLQVGAEFGFQVGDGGEVSATHHLRGVGRGEWTKTEIVVLIELESASRGFSESALDWSDHFQSFLAILELSAMQAIRVTHTFDSENLWQP
jgi:hypothetical protein